MTHVCIWWGDAVFHGVCLYTIRRVINKMSGQSITWGEVRGRVLHTTKSDRKEDTAVLFFASLTSHLIIPQRFGIWSLFGLLIQHWNPGGWSWNQQILTQNRFIIRKFLDDDALPSSPVCRGDSERKILSPFAIIGSFAHGKVPVHLSPLC